MLLCSAVTLLVTLKVSSTSLPQKLQQAEEVRSGQYDAPQ